MRKLLIILLLAPFIIDAQVSVYDCSAISPIVTQANIENAGNEYHKPCVLFEGAQQYEFTQDVSKKVTALENINIEKDFHAGPYTEGNMWLKLEEKSLFDVAVMNYPNLNGIKKLEKFELGIDLPNDIQTKIDNFVSDIGTDKINPYLEWEINVFAEFTHPSDPNSYWVAGFYTKEFEDSMNFTNPPLPWFGGTAYSDTQYMTLGGYAETPTAYNFRIRFAPPETGEWQCKIYITTPNQSIGSTSFTFNVIPSNNKGYLKVGQNQRYFAKGNNEPFYPIGGNATFPETNRHIDPELSQYVRGWDGNIGNWGNEVGEGYKTYYVLPRVYDKYKERLALLFDNGATLIRTMPGAMSTEIEFEKLGDYTQRLHMAQEVDEILELAEDKGAYFLWNMQHQNAFHPSAQGSSRLWAWDGYQFGLDFCYNGIEGTDNPIDFFTGAESKKYYKQRLRYILARWGYSTSIGVLELFSEINEVTNTGTEAGTFFAADANNPKIYTDWQKEMANFIKSHYNGSVHLLTANYTGSVSDPFTVSVDKPIAFLESGVGSEFDMHNLNGYDFNEPSFGGHFVTTIANGYLDENSFNSVIRTILEGTTNWAQETSRDVKPLVYSEMAVLNVFADPLTTCDYNKIEIDRHLWQSVFSGLAFGLEWDLWFRNTANLASLSQTSNFMNQFDLDGGGWHPGAMKKVDAVAAPDYIDSWIYKESYAKRMEGKNHKADLSYLRSGDRNYAIGVITNKTYNVYTGDDCFDTAWDHYKDDIDTNWSAPDFTQPLAVSSYVGGSFEKLKLKHMNFSKYLINYYTPNSFPSPISSSDDWGPKVKIEYVFNSAYPAFDYITIFMARKKNSSWLPTVSDSTELANLLKEQFDDTTGFDISVFKPQEDLIIVYPVPSSDIVTIESNEYSNLDVIVVGTDGKIQDSFKMRNKKYNLDISTYLNGVYFLKFYLGEDLVETKKLVKV